MHYIDKRSIEGIYLRSKSILNLKSHKAYDRRKILRKLTFNNDSVDYNAGISRRYKVLHMETSDPHSLVSVTIIPKVYGMAE